MAKFTVVTEEEAVDVEGSLRANGEVVDVNETLVAHLIEAGTLVPVAGGEATDAPPDEASDTSSEEGTVDAPQDGNVPTETDETVSDAPVELSEGEPAEAQPSEESTSEQTTGEATETTEPKAE